MHPEKFLRIGAVRRCVVCAVVGCGNCVLKIYTNTSGLPAYELCGENKSYIGMTILSQGNLLRLKYVAASRLPLAVSVIHLGL